MYFPPTDGPHACQACLSRHHAHWLPSQYCDRARNGCSTPIKPLICQQVFTSIMAVLGLLALCCCLYSRPSCSLVLPFGPAMPQFCHSIWPSGPAAGCQEGSGFPACSPAARPFMPFDPALPSGLLVLQEAARRPQVFLPIVLPFGLSCLLIVPFHLAYWSCRRLPGGVRSSCRSLLHLDPSCLSILPFDLAFWSCRRLPGGLMSDWQQRRTGS